jgi:phage tail sheath protein FI
MPEYLSPGVYVEEVDTGNKPIEGVATSTVGFLGVAERGPLNPTLITSFSEYVRMFGKYVANRFLARGVEGFFQNGGKRCFVARVVSNDPANPAISAKINTTGGELTLTAIGPGAWTNGRLAFKVSDSGLHLQDPSLFKLTVMYWDPVVNLPSDLTSVVDPTDRASMTNPNRKDATIIEVYDNLSADPLSTSFYERMINDVSVLITIKENTLARPANEPPPPAQPPAPAPVFFTNGNDGNPVFSLADFQGDPSALPGNRRALLALHEVDEIAVLCCPDEHLAGVTDSLIQQCEDLKDRFAILQAEQGAGPVFGLRPPTTSRYGAFYYPWLRILDPVSGVPMEIPPCGHIAGIYARSDIERGVHKAPANEVVRGLFLDPKDPGSGLQHQVVKGEQDILNPRGVNVLRYFTGRGNLVWGARTTTLDPDWKYVNVRRLFIFVEESIDEATQWVVFEPNDEPLWARVRRSVSAFLTRLWMDGMLQGKTKEEAYFVRCDRTTMTQADIDNGKLIMLIGIAPVKPAEFVIFRIGQWTGGSDVTEG